MKVFLFWFFFKLAFGSFASNSPVESPINNELLPLFFAGDMERERAKGKLKRIKLISIIQLKNCKKTNTIYILCVF
ncbi:hypothetical protein llap_4884 [Limosa lapponica baueri]|uniref:Uncharacterized protein n=1 Tax=Limosa lapponica baueri TaxID=1758121 RepID=A0A2I0UFJ6_LIMLA|nr:hypothetical protein llap_4884 [Limosa lapponica baueri]